MKLMSRNLHEKSSVRLALGLGKAMASAACVLALLLFVHAAPAGAPVADSSIGPWPSRSGELQIRYSSNLEPPIINRMHSWVLYVATLEGMPIADAELSVDGGMPEHDHGLPTQPRVTRYLGDGKYLLEGMRFHMPGDWEILVSIDIPGKQDVVVISLTL
ncbi:MAG: FixH family protein [Woeseia sp.]